MKRSVAQSAAEVTSATGAAPVLTDCRISASLHEPPILRLGLDVTLHCPAPDQLGRSGRSVGFHRRPVVGVDLVRLALTRVMMVQFGR